MDFPAIVSTAGLVSNAITAVKNARELLGVTSEPALREQIGIAFESLLNLREHVLNQDDEIRKLKAQLAERAAYVGPVPPHGYYYAADDTGKMHPLCPKCYQSNPSQIGFMHDAKDWSYGVKRDCKLCGKTIWEAPPNYSQDRAARDYNPYG